MNIKIYLTALIIFLALDFTWLGLIAKNFYSRYLGHLLTPDVNWLPAIIFYLLFVIGLTVFVILPAIDSGSLVSVIVYGSLFGLVSYATYDLTNMATLTRWPVIVTVVDLVWGSLLSAVVSTLTYLIYR